MRIRRLESLQPVDQRYSGVSDRSVVHAQIPFHNPARVPCAILEARQDGQVVQQAKPLASIKRRVAWLWRFDKRAVLNAPPHGIRQPRHDSETSRSSVGVLASGLVRHARTRCDGRRLSRRHVGDIECQLPSRSGRLSQASALDSGQVLAQDVHLDDIRAASHENLVEGSQILQRHLRMERFFAYCRAPSREQANEQVVATQLVGHRNRASGGADALLVGVRVPAKDGLAGVRSRLAPYRGNDQCLYVAIRT